MHVSTCLFAAASSFANPDVLAEFVDAQGETLTLGPPAIIAGERNDRAKSWHPRPASRPTGRQASSPESGDPHPRR